MDGDVKRSKRVDIPASAIEAMKMASRHMDEQDREKEGLPPDLPKGHPAIRAMMSQRHRESMGASKEKPQKKQQKKQASVDAGQKEKVKRCVDLIGSISERSVAVDKSLRELYEASVEASELMSDNPSMRVRLGRLGRMIFSFHAVLRDCCGPLQHVAQQMQQNPDSMKSEE